ncbi:MAG TPA: glycosyltransferase family 4 protein [Vicinamibacteria bacterium]|nr:glycosyltransferase family 4 protein [Vicinamibacteria bacterium]
MTAASPSKPRVLVFAWFYLPFVGGAELFLRALTERLRDRFDFVIVTSRRRRSLPSVERAPGVTIVRVGVGAAIDKFLYLAAAPLRALRLGRCDVVHAVMVSGGAFAAAAYLMARRRPSLLTLQDGDSEEYVRRYLGPLFPAYAPLHRRFDRVHAISSYLAARAVGYGVPPAAVTVVPNGCDLHFLDEARSQCEEDALRRDLRLDGARVVVSVSRLVLKNGLDRLLEAFPAVLREVPDAALLLVGEGEDRAALERQAALLGIDARVRFAGAVPHADVARYLRLGEVFARPSLSEGLGTAFLEAMACALPVVGTRTGGIPDFLAEGRTGLFCDPGRPETIAEAVVRLMRDRALARALGQAGRALVSERYRWEAVAARIAAMYDGLLTARAARR